ncbi:MAG: hypothetical protein PW735_04820 [Acidobacteriaceae bacterium]|nr:hypothetical protein [Acidobacteriaceae bacterium]
MTHAFDWNMLYLSCFGIGLGLCLVAFLTGSLHLHLGNVHGAHPGHGAGEHGILSSVLNAFTITCFLCWFGGAGFLLSREHTFSALLVLGLAVLCGCIGAGVLLWFLEGVLRKGERTLEPEDTEIVGVLGKLSQPVRAGGIGEMLYTQNGARRSVAVRSADGHAIERGEEVVVMSFSQGIAEIRRWTEFEQGLLSGDEEESVGQP